MSQIRSSFGYKGDLSRVLLNGKLGNEGTPYMALETSGSNVDFGVFVTLML